MCGRFRSWDTLAIGADGGIYITGTTQITANNAFLVKFTPDGDLTWQRKWGMFDLAGTMLQGLTSAFGVGAAPDGTVYITGNTFSTDTSGTSSSSSSTQAAWWCGKRWAVLAPGAGARIR